MIDDYQAVIFNWYAKVPVYHGWNYDTIGTEDERVRCGLIYEHGAWRGGFAIPIEHAEEFARPCGRCFRGDA